MSGGHFPKWDAIQISLSFVRVRHGCVFGNENQTVTEGFLLFVYSLSWPVYTGSFKKKKKKEPRHNASELTKEATRNSDTSSQLTEIEGGDDARLLTDGFLTEDWQAGLCSSLSSYSVTLMTSQFAWRNTIGDHQSLRESRIKLLGSCLLLFKEKTFTRDCWLEGISMENIPSAKGGCAFNYLTW